MATDFLNKVYDRYETRDFSLTDDNLNPKREIRASGDSTDSQEAVDSTLTAVAKRLKKIKEAYRTAVFETDDDPDLEADTAPSEKVAKAKTLKDLQNALLAGGGADGSIFRAGDDSEFGEAPVIDALMDEIDRMILQLMGHISPSGKSADVSNENKTSKPDSSKSSAKTGYDLTFGDRFDCSQYDGDGSGGDDDGGGDGDGDGNGGDGNGGDDLSGTSTKGSGDNSSDTSGDSNGSAGNGSAGNDGGADEGDAIDALWDDDAGNDDSQAEIDDAAAQCAVNQLGLLKAILVILKIIKVYQVIMTVIGAIIQIINVVQLAAGSWLNPTNFAKIAQIIAQLAIALLAGIISKLLQLLWDLLNEECSVKQAMSVWNEIIKSMNAAGQVFDETGKAITLTQSNIIAAAKAQNHLEELKKEMEAKYSQENIKKAAGQWASDSWDDITSIGTGFETGVKKGWADATKDVYGKFVPDGLKDMIKQTADAANALSAKYDKLAGTKVKTPAVEKALASLKGLKEE